MAHKKAGGSSRNGRDSHPKKLGLKYYKKNIIYPGYILVKQKGLKYLAGKGTKIGKDFTIFSIEKGNIIFNKIKHKTQINIKNIN